MNKRPSLISGNIGERFNNSLKDVSNLFGGQKQVKFWLRAVVFLILNFITLWAGSEFAGEGPQVSWYKNGLQAPWTPEGWVFGFAWFLIMFCFAFYMAKLYEREDRDFAITLFVTQIILNVGWNIVFFKYAQVGFALGVIGMLAFLIIYLALAKWKKMGLYNILILPYAIWMLVAFLLNLYFYQNNEVVESLVSILTLAA